MEMNLKEKRKELLRALSENEFSEDFHIFVTETLEDAEALGEDFAENIASVIVQCINDGAGDDETVEKSRFKYDFGKYVFEVKEALRRLDVKEGRIEKLIKLYDGDLLNAFNRGWSAEGVAENMNDNF